MSRRLKRIIPIDPEVERVWDEYWRDIVTDHGEPNLDLIKRELFDYHTALQEVPKVYDAITRGRFTKLNTRAGVILDCLERFYHAVETRKHKVHDPRESECVLCGLARALWGTYPCDDGTREVIARL